MSSSINDLLNATFSFKNYTSTLNLPSSWDALSSSNLFLSRDYLQVLQESAPVNMKCHFIGLFHLEELVGIALSQFIDTSTVGSYGERDDRLKTSIRNFVFKNFSSHVLFMGNNMLTGENGYFFSAALPVTDGLLLLNQAAKKIKKDYLSKNIKIHLTVFKDFTISEALHFKIPEFDSFYQFTTQPNMVFEIRENWHLLDDYILDLNKKYRDQYKRARKKAEGIFKRKLTFDEITYYKDRINDLYMQVARNAPFNTFYLPENHFEIFKKLIKSNFLFYGYFIEDNLIGFNTLIKNGTDIDTYFLGYDSQYQREKMLYLNMLYDMVGYSINKGYRKVIFARTALEIKSSIGAVPVKMFGYIKHSNPIINLFISKIFHYLEPEVIWQERNPFK